LTFLCVVTKELLQKGDSLNQNIQLFQIDFFFSDFTNNPESRVVNFGPSGNSVGNVFKLTSGTDRVRRRKNRSPS
jgi:hypothetical protein